MRVNDFGTKLKKIRDERNISISEISRGTEICRKTIHEWEMGRRYPKNIDRIEILANYLNVPVLYFFDNLDHSLKNDPIIKDILQRIEILENR